MNTGQTMLTILALTLLSIITMRYYSTIGYTGRNLSQTNAAFIATTVATSMMEQIDNCAYDQYTDTATTSIDSSRFTSPGSLGKESGESMADWRHYNDIDDFNSDTIKFTPGWMNEEYSVAISVYYVSCWGDINIKVTSKPTYVKRIDLTVWRSYPPLDTTEGKVAKITVSNLHGYYFFNPI